MDSNTLFCLFCGCSVPNHYDTFREEEHYFSIRRSHFISDESMSGKIKIQSMNCPNCHKLSIDIVGVVVNFQIVLCTSTLFHSQKSIQTTSLRL